jgi:hypothetical protein
LLTSFMRVSVERTKFPLSSSLAIASSGFFRARTCGSEQGQKRSVRDDLDKKYICLMLRTKCIGTFIILLAGGYNDGIVFANIDGRNWITFYGTWHSRWVCYRMAPQKRCITGKRVSMSNNADKSR